MVRARVVGGRVTGYGVLREGEGMARIRAFAEERVFGVTTLGLG